MDPLTLRDLTLGRERHVVDLAAMEGADTECGMCASNGTYADSECATLPKHFLQSMRIMCEPVDADCCRHFGDLTPPRSVTGVRCRFHENQLALTGLGFLFLIQTGTKAQEPSARLP